MKNILIKATPALVFAALSFFVSCPTEGTPDLPEKTISYQTPEDGIGQIQFYTNDWHFYNSNVISSDQTFASSPTTNYEIRVSKRGGYKNGGYGMIFGTSDPTNSDYYRLLITREGAYQLTKHDYASGNFTMTYLVGTNNAGPISSFLKKGDDQVGDSAGKFNTIKIETNPWKIVFNGREEPVTISSPALTASFDKLFLVTGICDSNNGESFPNSPVDVRFYVP